MTGSITFCGSLSHNNYDNNVSRLLENVLRRFAGAPRRLKLATCHSTLTGTIMDKSEMELLARRAGLETALAEFPDDVAAAAEQASGAVARMQAPSEPRAEPWPPMRVGSAP